MEQMDDTQLTPQELRENAENETNADIVVNDHLIDKEINDVITHESPEGVIDEEFCLKDLPIERKVKGLECLLRLSKLETKSVQHLLDVTLGEVIPLIDSKIGYIYHYDENTRLFILNTWSKSVMDECKILNPMTTYELDDAGCWGDVVRHRKPVIINNYHEKHPLVKGIPEGHIALRKFLSVPVFADGQIVAVVGVANKEADYNLWDVQLLVFVMDEVWKLLVGLKQKEVTMEDTEKAISSNKMKTSILTNMVHEIRSPMNSVLGFAGLLNEPGFSKAQYSEFIEMIQKSIKGVLVVLNEIVDITKIETGSVQPLYSDTKINDLLEYTCQALQQDADDKRLKLSYVMLPNQADSVIHTDREMLYAVLFNIGRYAIKNTESGSVEFGYVFKPDSRLPGANAIEFYVKILGISISGEKQENIFERFIPSNLIDLETRQGLGLGLSIAKTYSEMLRGTISFKSEPAWGGCFFISFPYDKEISIKSSHKDPGHENDIAAVLNGAKILVVEDNELSMVSLSYFLGKFNCKILYARTGKEAVVSTLDNPDIDLILMDIGMPEMNGFDATRHIRQFNKEVIIIAQTAYVMYGDKQKALEVGCNDFMSKPILKDSLYNIIVRNFNGKLAVD